MKETDRGDCRLRRRCREQQRAPAGDRDHDLHERRSQRRQKNGSNVDQKAVHKPDIEFVGQLVSWRGMYAPSGVRHEKMPNVVNRTPVSAWTIKKSLNQT